MLISGFLLPLNIVLIKVMKETRNLLKTVGIFGKRVHVGIKIILLTHYMLWHFIVREQNPVIRLYACSIQLDGILINICSLFFLKKKSVCVLPSVICIGNTSQKHIRVWVMYS